MKQFFVFILLTLSIAGWAQQDFNKHNPYVTNSEIHWLRQQEINLFNAPIVDDEFTENVRKTIDLRNAYNKETSKFAASVTLTSILLVIGTIGIINNAVTDDPGLPSGPPTSPGPEPTPTDLKSIFIVSGVAGVISGIFTFKIHKKRSEARSRRDQQLEITRNQYNILSGG